MKISLLTLSFVVLSTNCVSCEKIQVQRKFLLNFLNFQFAIKCDFRYSEDDLNYPEHIIDSLVERSVTAIETTIEKAKDFDCDDGFNNDTGKTIQEFISRFGETQAGVEDKPLEDLDDLEAESICGSTRKTIRPKVLPSIEDSKLVTVVNHGDFTQTVTIELCM
mgnify:CR=1 FL=1